MTCSPTLVPCPACKRAALAPDGADTRCYDPSSCLLCFGLMRVTRVAADEWLAALNARKTVPPP